MSDGAHLLVCIWHRPRVLAVPKFQSRSQMIFFKFWSNRGFKINLCFSGEVSVTTAEGRLRDPKLCRKGKRSSFSASQEFIWIRWKESLLQITMKKAPWNAILELRKRRRRRKRDEGFSGWKNQIAHLCQNPNQHESQTTIIREVISEEWEEGGSSFRGKRATPKVFLLLTSINN